MMDKRTMGGKGPNIWFAVTIAVAAWLLIVAADMAGIEAASTTAKESIQWCLEQHNGSLHNAQVMSEHEGLRCTLENGTTVHMSEVLHG